MILYFPHAVAYLAETLTSIRRIQVDYNRISVVFLLVGSIKILQQYFKLEIHATRGAKHQQKFR